MIAPPPAAETLARALAPWRRRIRLARAATWAMRGLGMGIAVAIVALIAGRLTPWADAATVAVAAVCLGVSTGGLGGWLAPISARRTAHTVDWTANLSDRVVTAWELRDRDESFARLQRADALLRLRGTEPGIVKPRVSRRDLSGVAVLAILGAIDLLAPNPMLHVLRQRQAEQARIAAARQQIQEMTIRTPTPTTRRAADQAKIDKALGDLAKQLAQSSDAPSALTAVSKTEEQLRSQVPPGGNQASASLDGEASALRQNAATRPLGDALATRDSAAVARATAVLQAALAKLTPEERAAIARTLQEAANAGASGSAGTGSDSTAASLRAAAQAIQQSDLREASAQIGAARDGLDQQLTASQTAEVIQQAVDGLGQARATISGVAQATARGNQSGSGQNAETGTANGGQSGAGAGQASANTNQTGAGSGQNSGGGGQSNDEGAGAGPGSGSQAAATGGQGQGGGRSAAESGKTTPGDQVFVPGQAGAGTSTQQAGPTGPGLGSEVPYQQVIGQYAQNAREHLDHRSLPPEMRDLVRKYFVGLEEGSGP